MIFLNDRVLRRLLELSIAGTRGGPMRLRIMKIVAAKPCNVNEISKAIGIDYKTAEYHVRVLEKSGFVKSSGKKYSDSYELSPILKANRKVLDELMKKYGKSIK